MSKIRLIDVLGEYDEYEESDYDEDDSYLDDRLSCGCCACCGCTCDDEEFWDEV